MNEPTPAEAAASRPEGNARRLAWFTDDELIVELRRRNAVAAIDVMRGATDDEAIGRVLTLAEEFDNEWCLYSDLRGIAGRRVRAAVAGVDLTAPATAEGDGA